MDDKERQDWVKVFAPATIANLGPLFDVGGLAIHGPGNQVWARFSPQPGIRLQVKGLGNLSSDPRHNAVGVVAAHVLAALRTKDESGQQAQGLELLLIDEIPVGSGLGSSAASSVAAAVAVNLLHGQVLGRAELVHAARRGEQSVSGSGHADNIAPALLGGVVVAPCYDPDDFERQVQLIRLPLPPRLLENLYLTIIRPDIQVNTLEAREVLKGVRQPIREMVLYAGALTAELACGKSPDCLRYHEIKLNAADELSSVAGGNGPAVKRYLRGTERMVRALLDGDVEEVGRAVEEDPIITDIRSQFIKDGDGRSLYAPVVNAAHESGAYGCSICGSGPSIFAVSDSEEKAGAISRAMADTLKGMGTEYQVFISTINDEGAYPLH